jgi:hypothetical protein
MKNTKLISSILTIFILFACAKKKAPVPLPTYHSFTGSISAIDNSTIKSNDGNFIICGKNNDAIFVLKTSKTGSLLWRREYAINNVPTSIIEVQSGDLYMSSDSLLWKFNELGDTLWTKVIGSNTSYTINDIAESTDGNIILSKSYSQDPGDSELYKIDSNGAVIWSQSIANHVIDQIVEIQTGEIVTTGHNGNGLVGMKLLVSKYDANGTEIWNNTITNLPKSVRIHSFIPLSSGDMMMCGECNLGGAYDYNGNPTPVSFSPLHFYAIKIDNTGNMLFSKMYGLGSANSIKKNNDDTFTITGYIEGDLGIQKIDIDGNSIWWKKIGDKNSGNALNILKNSENENIITGNSNGSVYLTVTDNDGKF